MCLALFANAQIEIQTPFNPATSSPIDVRLVIDNLSDTSNIAFPYEGMLVYVKSIDQYWYNQPPWTQWQSGGGTGNIEGVTNTANLSTLSALSSAAGSLVFTEGTNTSGDGGSSYWVYSSDNSIVVDTLNAISASGGGRWVRQLQGNTVYPEMYTTPVTASSINRVIELSKVHSFAIKGADQYEIDEMILIRDVTESVELSLVRAASSTLDTMCFVDATFLQKAHYNIYVDGGSNLSNVMGVCVNDIAASSSIVNMSAKNCSVGIGFFGKTDAAYFNFNGARNDTLVKYSPDFTTGQNSTSDQLKLNISGSDNTVLLWSAGKITAQAQFACFSNADPGEYAVELHGGYWQLSGEIRGPSGGIYIADTTNHVDFNDMWLLGSISTDYALLVDTDASIAGRLLTSGFKEGVLIRNVQSRSNLEWYQYADLLDPNPSYAIQLGTDTSEVREFALLSGTYLQGADTAIYLANCQFCHVEPSTFSGIAVSDLSDNNTFILPKRSANTSFFNNRGNNNSFHFRGVNDAGVQATLISNFVGIDQNVSIEKNENGQLAYYDESSSSFVGQGTSNTFSEVIVNGRIGVEGFTPIVTPLGVTSIEFKPETVGLANNRPLGGLKFFSNDPDLPANTLSAAIVPVSFSSHTASNAGSTIDLYSTSFGSTSPELAMSVSPTTTRILGNLELDQGFIMTTADPTLDEGAIKIFSRREGINTPENVGSIVYYSNDTSNPNPLRSASIIAKATSGHTTGNLATDLVISATATNTTTETDVATFSATNGLKVQQFGDVSATIAGLDAEDDISEINLGTGLVLNSNTLSSTNVSGVASISGDSGNNQTITITPGLNPIGTTILVSVEKVNGTLDIGEVVANTTNATTTTFDIQLYDGLEPGESVNVHWLIVQ